MAKQKEYTFADIKPLDFVYVNRIVKDVKADSTYYDGEYLVLNVGPGNKSFNGVRLATGYDLQSYHCGAFHESQYTLTDLYEDDTAIQRCINNNTEFLAGPRTQWCSSVYSGVEEKIRIITRLLEKKTGCCSGAVAQKTVTVICHTCGATQDMLKALQSQVAKLSIHLGLR